MAKPITEYELKIKKMSHICNLTSKKNKNQQYNKKKNLTRTKLDFSKEEGSYKNKSKHMELNSTPKQPDLLGVTINRTNSPIDGANSIAKTKKNHMLGDEQLKDLAAEIIKSRSGKWNDKYQHIFYIYKRRN